MRTTMRTLLAAATVLGVTAFGAATAQAHGERPDVNLEKYVTEIEVGYAHVPMAEVEDSKFVYIDQSATNVVFGDLELD